MNPIGANNGDNGIKTTVLNRKTSMLQRARMMMSTIPTTTVKLEDNVDNADNDTIWRSLSTLY